MISPTNQQPSKKNLKLRLKRKLPPQNRCHHPKFSKSNGSRCLIKRRKSNRILGSKTMTFLTNQQPSKKNLKLRLKRKLPPKKKCHHPKFSKSNGSRCLVKTRSSRFAKNNLVLLAKRIKLKIQGKKLKHTNPKLSGIATAT